MGSYLLPVDLYADSFLDVTITAIIYCIPHLLHLILRYAPNEKKYLLRIGLAFLYTGVGLIVSSFFSLIIHGELTINIFAPLYWGVVINIALSFYLHVAYSHIENTKLTRFRTTVVLIVVLIFLLTIIAYAWENSYALSAILSIPFFIIALWMTAFACVGLIGLIIYFLAKGIIFAFKKYTGIAIFSVLLTALVVGIVCLNSANNNTTTSIKTPNSPSYGDYVNPGYDRPAPEQGDYFIGNTKTKKYHEASCSYLPDYENRRYFDSESQARRAGYVPCGHCDP